MEFYSILFIHESYMAKDSILVMLFWSCSSSSFLLEKGKHTLDSTGALVAIDSHSGKWGTHTTAWCCTCLICHGTHMVFPVFDLVQPPQQSMLRMKQVNNCVLPEVLLRVPPLVIFMQELSALLILVYLCVVRYLCGYFLYLLYCLCRIDIRGFDFEVSSQSLVTWSRPS